MTIVSALVLSVPMLIVLPEVPVPRLTLPVLPKSTDKACAPAEHLIVKAPLTAILLVVKVWNQRTLPVIKLTKPPAVTDHLLSVIATPVEKEEPRVMVFATESD